MNNSRKDLLSISMYPSGLLHEYGVNGKISGSVGAVGEIKDTLLILHSPKGCGFHYRQSARRRHQPYYQLICSELTEQEVILGGEDEIYETAKEAYFRYHPKLIVLIPSPVSDVMNENLFAVADRLKSEGIEAVAVRSELFSHRDREYGRKRLKELASQKIGEKNKLEVELKGCGFTEALYALVEQFMVKCPKIPRSINIETVAWGSEGACALHEIEAFLKRAGITVNCWLPSDSVERIKRAPAAELNVVRRIRWAKRMKEKFGTEYLHLGSPGRYEGLEGISNFYLDIGERLGVLETMRSLVEREEETVEETLSDEFRVLKETRCVLVSRSLQNAPFLLKRYAKDYKMQVSAVVIRITESVKKELKITEEIEKKLIERFYEAAELYAPGCILALNPDEKQTKLLFSNADILAGTGDFRLEGQGLPVIPEKKELLSLSFESYVRSVKRMKYLIENTKEKPNLLLNKLDFSEEYFPLLAEKDVINGKIMWSRMWLEREKWKEGTRK